jgi:hypothetical protein
MDALFKKLNFKDQPELFVLNIPENLLHHLDAMQKITTVSQRVSENEEIHFALAFAITQKQLNDAVHAIAPRLMNDAIFWVAYPKGSSKKYKCEFNRDTGWEEMGSYGMEGVRQVAIDEDWSALRFRKVDFIKNFTRNEKMILSQEGKARK